MSTRTILGKRERSSRVSTWTEYLTVKNCGPRRAILEICQYEALCEWENEDKEGNEIELPKMYEGIPVVGVDDGCLIGGELSPSDHDDQLEYSVSAIEDAIEWIKKRGFDVDANLRASLETHLFSVKGSDK